MLFGEFGVNESQCVLLNHLKMTMMQLHLNSGPFARLSTYWAREHIQMRVHISAAMRQASERKGKPMHWTLSKKNSPLIQPSMALVFSLVVLAQLFQHGPCPIRTDHEYDYVCRRYAYLCVFGRVSSMLHSNTHLEGHAPGQHPFPPLF